MASIAPLHHQLSLKQGKLFWKSVRNVHVWNCAIWLSLRNTMFTVPVDV